MSADQELVHNLSMVASYLRAIGREVLAHDVDAAISRLSQHAGDVRGVKHPIRTMCIDLMGQIEKCGHSDELTRATLMASELLHVIEFYFSNSTSAVTNNRGPTEPVGGVLSGCLLQLADAVEQDKTPLDSCYATGVVQWLRQAVFRPASTKEPREGTSKLADDDQQSTDRLQGASAPAPVANSVESRPAPTENSEQIIEGCNRYANRRAYKSAPTPEAVPVATDEVLYAIKRPEGYEDVHPDLLADDAFHDFVQYRVINTTPPTPQQADTTRDAVIEECARVCQEQEVRDDVDPRKDGNHFRYALGYNEAIRDCVAAISALKGKGE